VPAAPGYTWVMPEWLWLLLAAAVYIALQRWLLPRLGIKT
jgi:hypothetical protein